MRNCSAITQVLFLFLLSFTGIPFEVRQGYNGLARPFLTTLRGGIYMAKAKWYQTPVYLLLALALALLAGMPFVPQAAASPGQETFYSTVDDGFIFAAGNSYSAVHQAPSGTLRCGEPQLCVGQVEQLIIPPSFNILRGALFFDTSSLPDDATINSAVLSLYGTSDNSSADFDITMVDGSGLNQPLQDTDYGYLGSQNVSGGSFNTSGFSTLGYNDIPLNETGLGWISKTGITKLGLRSSRDIAAIAPSTLEFVTVYPSEEGEGYRPKLVVTYTTPPPPPAVPAINHWGIIVMVALFAGFLVWTPRRWRPASYTSS